MLPQFPRESSVLLSLQTYQFPSSQHSEAAGCTSCRLFLSFPCGSSRTRRITQIPPEKLPVWDQPSCRSLTWLFESLADDNACTQKICYSW